MYMLKNLGEENRITYCSLKTHSIDKRPKHLKLRQYLKSYLFHSEPAGDFEHAQNPIHTVGQK